MSERTEKQIKLQTIQDNLHRLLNADHLSDDQKDHIQQVAQRMTALHNEE